MEVGEEVMGEIIHRLQATMEGCVYLGGLFLGR